MPQAYDLVIYNASGVAKTFKLVTPAAGDGGIAQWALKEGAISSVFPVYTASATGSPRGRTAKMKFALPSVYTDSATGLPMVRNRAEANWSFSIPADFPEALKGDWVAYNVGLFTAELTQALMKDAVSAT